MAAIILMRSGLGQGGGREAAVVHIGLGLGGRVFVYYCDMNV